MFVIGDIEDSDIAFFDALTCIDMINKTEFDYLKLLFLGDIYTSKNPSMSIKRIEMIFIKLRIPIVHYIDEKFSELERTGEEIYEYCNNIKNKFDEIYDIQNIDLYSTSNKFKHIKEIERILDRDKENRKRFIFLLGNKEIDLIRDLHGITSMNIINGDFVSNFTYFDKHKKYEITIKFTIHEVNVLINYLLYCSHVFITENILMTHIYTNARLLIKAKKIENIKKVIAGHNRCFGRFIDTDHENLEIYILDISHEKAGVIRNFIYLLNNEVNYFPLKEIVYQILTYKFSANKTFLRGGWGPDDVGTLEFYLSRFDDIKYDQG